MKWIVTATIAFAASVTCAAAQPAKEPYQPGLGEFMTATQLRRLRRLNRSVWSGFRRDMSEGAWQQHSLRVLGRSNRLPPKQFLAI
jgi:hypothetical protein